MVNLCYQSILNYGTGQFFGRKTTQKFCQSGMRDTAHAGEKKSLMVKFSFTFEHLFPLNLVADKISVLFNIVPFNFQMQDADLEFVPKWQNIRKEAK